MLNYPGIPAVTGEELASRFFAQAEEMELTITEKMVSSITSLKNHYYLMNDPRFQSAVFAHRWGVVRCEAYAKFLEETKAEILAKSD